MTRHETTDETPSEAARVEVPSDTSGSKSEPFRLLMVRDTLNGCSLPDQVEAEQRAQHQIAALFGMKPEDELQGLVASQILLANSAACECFKRAAIPEQHPEYRAMNIKLAVKAQGSMVKLIESLQKLKGQAGQQSVHVHHHHHQQDNRTQVAAANAVVNINHPQGEGERKNAGQPREPHALPDQPGLPAEPDAALRSQESARQTVPSSSDARQEEV